MIWFIVVDDWSVFPCWTRIHATNTYGITAIHFHTFKDVQCCKCDILFLLNYFRHNRCFHANLRRRDSSALASGFECGPNSGSSHRFLTLVLLVCRLPWLNFIASFGIYFTRSTRCYHFCRKRHATFLALEFSHSFVQIDHRAYSHGADNLFHSNQV